MLDQLQVKQFCHLAAVRFDKIAESCTTYRVRISDLKVIQKVLSQLKKESEGPLATESGQKMLAEVAQNFPSLAGENSIQAIINEIDQLVFNLRELPHSPSGIRKAALYLADLFESV